MSKSPTKADNVRRLRERKLAERAKPVPVKKPKKVKP